VEFVSLASMIGALVTAGATIMLWRVTNVLAAETRRLAAATSQPQVVVTIEPNPWSMIHADLVVANTGNATAFEIVIAFDPPLNLDHEGTSGPTEPPFRQISALRPSQSLTSWVGKMYSMLESRHTVSVSWKRSPTSAPETYSYVLDMSDYQNLRRLGSGDPLVQIAGQSKKMQEDIHKIASGWSKVKIDVFTSNDRRKELRRYEEATDDETNES